VKNIDKEIVSIDGKAVRQANRMMESNPIHLVSAWASANELIFGQVKTDEKSNEITAIPALLEALFLEGSTVNTCKSASADLLCDLLPKKMHF